MTSERRVVITGLGAITPLGIGTENFWQGLLEGRSGVGLVTDFDCSAIATRIAAQVKDFSPEAYMERKEAKRLDRFAQFAVAASKMALEDSGLAVTDANKTRIGTFLGSGIGGIATFEEQHRKMMDGGLGRVSPFFIPMMIANMGAGNVARMLGLQGPSETAVTACATSTNSLGDAFACIKRGDADAAVAGGSEAAVVPISMAGFSNMKAMSSRNDDPTHASRPFDTGRDGFILGEGGCVLTLEELDGAKARGARIYAEILGYGMSNDAYDMVHGAPHGDGVRRAMTAALAEAKVSPSEVGYINAHATSTPTGDPLEIQGIKAVFGDAIYQTAISSIKSMTGHLLGAAGAIEAIAVALALSRGILPPTTNLVDPDPECAGLNLVPNTPQERQVNIAMSNSFGFGGHNATLVFKRWTGD